MNARPGRRSPGLTLAVAAALLIPWWTGAVWLAARALSWASPHVLAGDGLTLVVVLVGALAVVGLLATWPAAADTDRRDTEQALAARTALRPTPARRRPACPPEQHRPWETR